MQKINYPNINCYNFKLNKVNILLMTLKNSIRSILSDNEIKDFEINKKRY